MVNQISNGRSTGSPWRVSRNAASAASVRRWQSRCSAAGGMKRVVGAWLREEDGQDLIEYMLLGATVDFAGAVAFGFLSEAMNSTYSAWDTAVQSDELVDVPCPAA